MNLKDYPLIFCGFIGLLLLQSGRITGLDGNWTEWSLYGSLCSATCGKGSRTLHRTCTNPSPTGSDLQCLTEAGARALVESKVFPCDLPDCFINLYTDWTPPCINCTNGVSYKYPICENNTRCTGAVLAELTQKKNCPGWDKQTCPSPCETAMCPALGLCKDVSTKQEPKFECECTMGTVMNEEKTACTRVPPTPPPPRPIPTLPPEQKKVATVVSKSASSMLITFVGITLVLFGILRIFTTDRVIQMNMEIALILAHVFLMFPTETFQNVILCKIVSICIHFFFTACFNFMMLEALHMYSLVAFVVKGDGLLTRLQNILIGWGLAIIIICFCIAFEFDNYGGEYHCWLQMNTNLLAAQWIPYTIVTVVTLALIEAAGNANYKPLKNINKKQLFSARISQRTNLIILPFVIAHMLVGMLSEYEQNLPLYGTFSVLNGITGALIFFLHCSSNSQVRTKLKACYRSMTNRSN